MNPAPRRRSYDKGDENGGYVTRAELAAHLNPMRDDISEIREDVHEIRTALGAGPRWLGARANSVIDKLLPTLLALAAVWLLGEKLAG
jgi:hypothetical protein